MFPVEGLDVSLVEFGQQRRDFAELLDGGAAPRTRLQVRLVFETLVVGQRAEDVGGVPRRIAIVVHLVTTAALAAAAAVLAIGLVIAIRPDALGFGTGTNQVAGSALEMSKVSDTPINATISMTGYGWGTRIDMACTYGDWGRRDAPPQNLGMVVVGRDGSQSQIATWLGLSGATALPSANTPLPMEEIAAVQLVSSDSGQVLLEKHL